MLPTACLHHPSLPPSLPLSLCISVAPPKPSCFASLPPSFISHTSCRLASERIHVIQRLTLSLSLCSSLIIITTGKITTRRARYGDAPPLIPPPLVMATNSVPNGQHAHEPVSSTALTSTDLHVFHAKYSCGDVFQSALGGHDAAADQQNAKALRENSLKLKRQRLHELQEWEYQAATEPRYCVNPGPVGLLAFGLTTILLNLHNTGRFPLSTVVVGMGICLGGGAQFVVGLLEWVRGNAFAYVAFTSYGAFWLSLVCVWTLPNTAAGTSVIVEPATGYFVGVYLLMWGIFSSVMLLCTIRMNVAIFLVFLTVTLLFLMLGCSSMANSAAGLRAAGYEGIVCGSLALYLAFAEILNEAWDRTILPVIPMTQLLDWLSSRTQKSTGGSDLENNTQLPKAH
ncbi:GPR1/FUN34/yaaH family, putative [Leishmania tarentolae]|uniref:GPR1/FUN34/yaaH family, putative n=1 Tax=Leishmania tarentolae TaxID=5689 RepID=A0A640K7K6_LEITA|nr:GPR1/FUN34/yaaH family, putative [Leishmania tarentolae]